jgi:cysteine desulfurase/selenocysteine lyase
LKEAVNFIQRTGHEQIQAHEAILLNSATDGLLDIPGVKIFGTAASKVSVISFLLENMHPFDTGMLLDAKGIAVRTGHHCTQPLMERFCIEGTVRASFAVYNSLDEVDRLIESVKKIVKR